MQPGAAAVEGVRDRPSAAPPLVVLGGGCAGLMAALTAARRGVPVLLLEQEGTVGGLAGGVTHRGRYYEKGPHIFHSVDELLVAEVKALAGGDFREVQRSIGIWYLERMFRFPLAVGEVMSRLPLAVVARAGLSLAWDRLAALVRRPAVETSETVLVASYGRVLYRIFFADYITQFWGIPPSAFSPAFARRRIPRINVLEVLDRLPHPRRRRRLETRDFVEKVEGRLYSTPRASVWSPAGSPRRSNASGAR